MQPEFLRARGGASAVEQKTVLHAAFSFVAAARRQLF